MRTIVYIGLFADGVEISDTGQWANRLEPIDVVDDVAARLLEQPTNWALPGDVDEPHVDGAAVDATEPDVDAVDEDDTIEEQHA